MLSEQPTASYINSVSSLAHAASDGNVIGIPTVTHSYHRQNYTLLDNGNILMVSRNTLQTAAHSIRVSKTPPISRTLSNSWPSQIS